MQPINAQVIDITSFRLNADKAKDEGLKNYKDIALLGLDNEQVLQASRLKNQRFLSGLMLLMVLIAHLIAIYFIALHSLITPPEPLPNKPMLVSLIAPPAPKPELVPIIEPPKPQPKPVIKPKPILKKVILPIEQPVLNPVEAVEEVPAETTPEPTAPVQEVVEAKAPPAKTPVVEEKIEPPKFGVAYLNNPEPAYPRLSKRAGEEGRVLLRVLVSESGAAATVDLEKTSGFDRLDEAAIEAVKKWRFIPARKNNQNLSAQVIVPIRFSLSN